MGVCGALWPDGTAPDGRPITCQLEREGHNPYHHAWWHELHVKPGKPFGDARFTWHTTLGLAVAANAGPMNPTTRIYDVDEEGQPLYESVPHPTHVMLAEARPTRRTK